MRGRLEDNFASHFEHIADLAPDRLMVAAGERELTWGWFDELADRLAGHLAAHGIGQGDRVAVNAYNRPEHLVALHALYKLMAIPVNVNYRYRAAEIRYVLESSRARGVIVDDELADVTAEAAAAVPGCDLTVRIDPEGGFGAEVAAADRHPRRPRGDTEWLLFTGGTTGHPKAVIGSHTERLRASYSGGFAALGLDTDELDEREALHQALDIDPHGQRGVVWLPASPLMHGTGLYSTMSALVVGAPVVLLPGRVTGAALLEAIGRHRVTDMTIVGDAFALRLADALDAAAAAGAPLGVDALRTIRSVGAVWTPGVKRRLLTHADLRLIDTIACTEGGVFATSEVTRDTIDDHDASFRLLPRARLIDEDDRDVEPGSGVVGMLAAPVVPEAGYEGDAEKTASAFRTIDGERYSVPGDMATLEIDGRLRLLGRGSSVINTGGEKVFTDEVELVLRAHPGVHDATVVGVPDPNWGNVVAAVVSLREGSAAEPEELAGFVGERLAGYKKPRRVVVVPQVQRLATGKADLSWARRQFAETGRSLSERADNEDAPAPTAP